MSEKEKQTFLDKLDGELLLGGVIISEWATFLVRDADLAFVNGAYLSSLLTALAGIECHLRFEFGTINRLRLVDLIDSSGLTADLVAELHLLRRYRNLWVHVENPSEDSALLENPAGYEIELEQMATRSMHALRKVLYANQWV